MKVLFTYDYGPQKMNLVRELGYEVVIIPEKEITNSPEVNDSDILICYDPFSRINIKEMPRLKWIQVSSIGIDQVPIEVALEREMLITNNNGGYSKPISEWAVMNLLEIMKNRRQFYDMQKNRVWKLDTSPLEIVDKRIGFLGTGTIPQETAIRLHGFEADLIGFNTDGRAIEYFHECHKLKDLGDYISTLDVLIVSLPHTPKTHHVLDRAMLEKMKEDAVIINVSRGSIIDEDALIECLQKGKFRGVALDVFEIEPLPSNSKLWDFDRVYLSPHNAWVSEKRNDRRFELIYKNLKRFIKGKDLVNVIDLERGY